MSPRQKSPLIAFLLGFFLLGFGLLYVLPLRKVLPIVFVTFFLLIGSGGTLWIPLGLGVGLVAARLATRGGELAFHGGTFPELYELKEAESLPHPKDRLVYNR